MPNNCIFLVDTYDTVRGIQNAIIVGKELRDKGYEMVGIRLDSGDLTHLSKVARNLLDEAGFPNACIVASNDLDEHMVEEIKELGGKIDTWGIGTKLVTAYDQAALGGVYKLAAIEEDGKLVPKIKLGSAAKVSFPGDVQVRRVFKGDEFIGDYLFDCSYKKVLFKDPNSEDYIDFNDLTSSKYQSTNLLELIYQEGALVHQPLPLAEIRERSKYRQSQFELDHHLKPFALLEENYQNKRKKMIIDGIDGVK